MILSVIYVSPYVWAGTFLFKQWAEGPFWGTLWGSRLEKPPPPFKTLSKCISSSFLSSPPLRVAQGLPVPPLSFLLSGGDAGRRGDGLGGWLYILGLDLAVRFAFLLVCVCFVVADARLLTPSLAGSPAISGGVGARSFLLCSLDPWRILCRVGEDQGLFNNQEALVSVGGTISFILDGRGGAGQEGDDAAARRVGRCLWWRCWTPMTDACSGADRRLVGGRFAGSARCGRCGSVDLRSVLQHGDEPRSTGHSVYGSSSCGELLHRLVKPTMAMVLVRIWQRGEDGVGRDLQALICNFLLLEVFSANVPGQVFFLGCSSCIRVRVFVMFFAF